MNESIFELNDVSYAYQDQLAIDRLSLKIKKGDRVALLGANGSGKSTLLRLLDALCFSDRGEVHAFGSVLSESGLADEKVNFAFRRRVGLVFQNPDVQLFNPTVFDEVAFGPLQLGWARDRIMPAVAEILARFSIGHLKDRAPHRLSGGEKKRVALASVLILKPEVLLLDEPTASLDPESQGEVIRFLIESQGSERTVVIATHDLNILEDIADHVFVLVNGRLAGAGKPADILADRELLRNTHLTHAHWHIHDNGDKHLHPHTHGHAHEHHAAPERDYRLIKRG